MICDRLPESVETVATQIVDAIYTVHKRLGAGLLESVYEECLLYELTKRKLKVQRQVSVPIIYDGIKLGADLRLDILVEGSVIIEVKAVEQMIPVFQAQLLTYMKLSNIRLGFLVNFNVPLIKEGLKRLIR